MTLVDMTILAEQVGFVTKNRPSIKYKTLIYN